MPFEGFLYIDYLLYTHFMDRYIDKEWEEDQAQHEQSV